MSYILEALRRAEAERSAGRTPDVRSVVETAPVADVDDPAHRRKPLAIAAGLALALVLVVAGVWAVLALRDRPVPPPVAAASLPASAASAATSALAPVVEAVPEPALPDDPPELAVPRMAVIEAEAPPPPVQPPSVAKSASASVPRTSAAPAPASAPVARTSPAAASAPAGVPTRDQLPADLRRTLPPITIGGTVFSSDPAQRLLIVDGELWREGDQIRPDLVIEQIRSRDAVLRYRGVRFSVSP